MIEIPFKTRVIYLQIILFLLSSFGLLIQNASASTCHLHDDSMSMQMELSAMMGHEQMDHDDEKCCDSCDSCDCAGQHCMINCSMLISFATFLNTDKSVLLHHDKPASAVPDLVGIVHLPERHPPRLRLL